MLSMNEGWLLKGRGSHPWDGGTQEDSEELKKKGKVIWSFQNYGDASNSWSAGSNSL